MSDSVRPRRRQPTRLHHPWDSPGKNTEVGCHFLLQDLKVKSESEVAQSCPTLSNPMDCSLPGSSIHGIFQARILEWGAIAFSYKLNLIIMQCFYLYLMLFNMHLILWNHFLSHENFPISAAHEFLSLALLLLESKSRCYSFSQNTRNQSSLFIHFSKWIVMIFSQHFMEIYTMCFICLNQTSYTGTEKSF